MLLLLQFASQNIAFFCCALYAGAATYVCLVEHPAVMAGGAELADAYALMAHPRPVVLKASFGAVGALAALLAGVAGGAPWWLAGGALLGAAAAVEVLVVMPLVRRCLDIDARANVFAAEQLFRRLVRLHAALSLAGLGALSVFILSA
ncbi:MAG: hypothetical protein ACT4P3_02195 [Betaproteobacteria bacterium]